MATALFSSLPTGALTAAVLFATVPLSGACQSIPHLYGSLDSDSAISGGTVADVNTPCECCAFCNQEPRCKSFVHHRSRRECVLHDAVGTYSRFTRLPSSQNDAQFFFMPNGSKSGEFCRSQSDCQTPGDSCNGRICTTDPTVTCRDIYDMNNAMPNHYYFGSVEGSEILFYCWMQQGNKGYTTLVKSRYYDQWTTQNRLNRRGYDANYNYNDPFSHLWAADAIRDSRPGGYYVWVVAYGDDSSRGVRFKAPRAASLLHTEPTFVEYGPSHGDFSFRSGSVSFPYLTEQHGVLYHLNFDKSSDEGSILRSFYTEDDYWVRDLKKPGTVYVFIREGE